MCFDSSFLKIQGMDRLVCPYFKEWEITKKVKAYKTPVQAVCL